MVKASTWLTHLEYDLESPVWSHWVRFFSDHFTFIRYDERGCGLTDRSVEDLSFDRWVEDLEAVIDAAGIDGPVSLLGISQGTATALAYAARYPDKVSSIIAYGGYAQGWSARGDQHGADLYQAIVDVMALGWEAENPVFRELFTKRFIPGGNEEQLRWFNDLCRNTVSAGMAARLLMARAEVDVMPLLDKVAVPVLVVHSRQDEVVPFDQGRMLASRLSDAELVELASRNHILLRDEAAWTRLKEAVLDFRDRAIVADSARPPVFAGVSRREREILALICEAKSNPEIAEILGLSGRTVRNHASNLFRKLGVKSRAEAILLCHGGRVR